MHKLPPAVLCCDACTIVLGLGLQQAPQRRVNSMTQFQPTAAQQRPHRMHKINYKMLRKVLSCPRSTLVDSAPKQQTVDGAVVGNAMSSRKCLPPAAAPYGAAAGGSALLQQMQFHFWLVTYALLPDSRTITDAAVAAVQPGLRTA